jgi:hypothetical protein
MRLSRPLEKTPLGQQPTCEGANSNRFPEKLKPPYVGCHSFKEKASKSWRENAICNSWRT